VAGERQSMVTVGQGDAWRADLDVPSAAVSGDGRFIAFTSYLPLVAADVNARRDVYVLDCADGRITLESLSPSGRLWDADSGAPAISADGWTLVYETIAPVHRATAPRIVLRDRRRSTTELIGVALPATTTMAWSGSPALSGDGQVIAFVAGPEDGPGTDVYAVDRGGGDVRRVSVDLENARGRRNVTPSLSADGRVVAFASSVAGQDGGRRVEVYVRDVQRGTTHRIIGPADRPRQAPSWDPVMSANGRFVVFVSEDATLAPNDRNRSQDVFVYDLHTRTANLVSRGVGGGSGNGRSGNPAISADGRYVAFQSEASDLVCAEPCRPAEEDINLLWDVFLLDRQTRAMTRVSGDAQEGWMAASGGPAVDGFGRVVAFASRHPTDGADTRNDFDLFIWTASPTPGALAAQERCAPRASARTASTIDMSPMPLPIEMFWRKMRSTMELSMRAISSGGSPESVRSRIDASARADTPDGFSTAK
jgi:Tol biopolymer transport system component